VKVVKLDPRLVQYPALHLGEEARVRETVIGTRVEEVDVQLLLFFPDLMYTVQIMLLLEVAVEVVLSAIAVALAITMDLYQIMEVMEVVDQLSMAGMEWDKQ